MTVPEGMTPAKLRKIAKWLDTYDRMGEQWIMLLKKLGKTTDEDAAIALEAVQADNIQEDLRKWADEIESANG